MKYCHLCHCHTFPVTRADGKRLLYCSNEKCPHHFVDLSTPMRPKLAIEK